MIPDKIYVRVGTLSSNGSAEDYILPEWYEMPHIGSIDYIRKDAIINYVGKISMAVNSFSKDFPNTFRAEGANKTISLITEYLENL